MLRRSALLLCAALAACRIEVSDLPSDTPASALVQVLVVDTPGVRRVQLLARFQPGVDEQGEPRRVLADSLGIFGAWIPAEVHPSGALLFRRTWPVETALAGIGGPLSLPAANGLAPPPLTTDVHLTSTDAPDTLLVGDELVLPLRHHGAIPVDARWQSRLDIRSTDGLPVLRLTFETPADTIRIARSLLPDIGEGRLNLIVVKRSGYELLSDQYLVATEYQSTIIRVLRFTDPSP